MVLLESFREIQSGVMFFPSWSTKENDMFVPVHGRASVDHNALVVALPHSSGPGVGMLLPDRKSFGRFSISATPYGFGRQELGLCPQPMWTFPVCTGWNELGLVAYFRFLNSAGPIVSVLTVVSATSERAAITLFPVVPEPRLYVLPAGGLEPRY